MRSIWTAATLVAITCSAPVVAATPRELLTQAAFQATTQPQALALVNQAYAQADQQLAANPRDREAFFQRAMAIGYRAKLTRKPGDAKASRALFEQYAAQNPRDPEAQIAIGGWHLDAIADGFLAQTVLGAKKAPGIGGLDRAVLLGGDRAFFKGMAALMRIRLDPADVATARTLAEQASRAPMPTALDRIAKRDADLLLVPLRAGDGKAAAQLARTLLPFGRIG